MSREEAIGAITYSWQEWENLERHTGYAEARAILEPEFPEVFRAYETWKAARTVMGVLIEQMS